MRSTVSLYALVCGGLSVKVRRETGERRERIMVRPCLDGNVRVGQELKKITYLFAPGMIYFPDFLSDDPQISYCRGLNKHGHPNVTQ